MLLSDEKVAKRVKALVESFGSVPVKYSSRFLMPSRARIERGIGGVI